MVQSLEVISVNLWDILISLANLLILYLLMKKFLFKPVQNIIAKREDEISSRYLDAENARKEAEKSRSDWESQLSGAKSEADRVVKEAYENAKLREGKILDEAKSRADSIVKNAEVQAELEYKKASDKIKSEIVEVSGRLTEKILEREINEKDHHNLIDSFIEKIGDGNDRNQ